MPNVARHRVVRRLRQALVIPSMFVLAACPTRSVIRTPPAVSQGTPATVANPVQVSLDWSVVQHRIGDPSVSLDGNDVTGTFGQNIQCCQSASATFTLTPGAHNLNVSVPRSASLGTYIETLPFTVVDPGFTITLSPAAVTLAPSGSASVTATVVPTFNYGGAVTLAIAGLPAGVTSSITPAGGGTSFTIALAAGPGAAGGTTTATITGSGPCTGCSSPAATASTPLGITVTGPGFTIASLTPATVLLPRGGSATVTATVTRTGGFTGAIGISATGLPNGVTAPPTTIPPNATSGTITLNASNAAALAGVAAGTAPSPQTVTIALTGVCASTCPPGLSSSRNVSVRIGRRLGQFAVATPSLRNAPSSATSADGAIGLDYTTANPQPPGQTLFTATYRRVGSSAALSAINLAQSAISWGAGFCGANPTIAGVVLSGTYGSVTNAPMFYELPIWAPAPSTTNTARTVMQPVYAINSSANTTITPTLWFSPDCTVAAFVQSSFAPSPPAGLTLLDMTTGQPIGQAMLYTGASPSRLEVVNAGTGQEVRVQFTTSDVRTVPVP